MTRPRTMEPATGTRRVPSSDAFALVAEVLRALGAPTAEAEAQATLLVEGDLRGRASHGIQRLPTLAARIRNGVLNPGLDAEVSWVGDAFALVDGRGGFGATTARTAITAVVGRAREFGIAAAAMRNCSHLGMLAPHLEAITDAGMAAIAMTTSEAVVHPAGGREALVGTNPIGIGVPVPGGRPFILDMSTAAISVGEIHAHAHRGDALPEGRAVDAVGRPTTDPAAALEGAISPFGGAKGYALGVAIELLVASLSRTSLGTDVMGTLDPSVPVTKGDLIIALDQARIDPDDTRLGAYLDVLRASEPDLDGKPVAVPGDRMRAERERRLRDGIPIPERLWTELVALRDELTDKD